MFKHTFGPRKFPWALACVVCVFSLVGAPTTKCQTSVQPLMLSPEASIDDAAKLDLHEMKWHPDWLNNRDMMRYFIALNNCHNPAVESQLNNELRYPALFDLYSKKKQEIFRQLPDHIAVDVLFSALPQSSLQTIIDALTKPDESELSLGEYNRRTQAFPLVFNRVGNMQAVHMRHTIDLGSEATITVSRRNGLSATCPVAARVITPAVEFGPNSILPQQYYIKLTEMGFDSLAMSEADADRYITRHPTGTQRRVYLRLIFQIEDSPDVFGGTPNAFGDISATRHAQIPGKLTGVEVMDMQTRTRIGFLFDDRGSTALSRAQTARVVHNISNSYSQTLQAIQNSNSDHVPDPVQPWMWRMKPLPVCSNITVQPKTSAPLRYPIKPHCEETGEVVRMPGDLDEGEEFWMYMFPNRPQGQDKCRMTQKTTLGLPVKLNGVPDSQPRYMTCDDLGELSSRRVQLKSLLDPKQQ